MSRARSHRLAPVSLIAFLLGALVAAAPAEASNPASQHATVPSKTGKKVVLTWTGTILPGTNPESDCTAGTSPEDHHMINLSVPSGAYRQVAATATFSISWQPSTGQERSNDEILTVLGPGGKEVSSSDGGTTTESVGTDNPKSGTYDAVACGFANALPQTYTGKLVITTKAATAGGCPPAGPNRAYDGPKSSHRPRVLRDRQAGVDCLRPLGPEQGDTDVEPSIAANPQDPNNAVAVYQEGRVDSGCSEAGGFATTFDGGKTWTHGDVPGLTVATGGPAALASDYVVAFGPDNYVYA